MYYQISKVFIILSSFVLEMAFLPTKDKNNETILSMIEVKPMNVYFELKKYINHMLINDSLNEDYEDNVLMAKRITDHTIVRAMIQNDKVLIENILTECKEIGDDLNFVDYISQLRNKFINKIYNRDSLNYPENEDEILRIIFKYYSNDSDFVSMPVFLDFLINENIKLDEKDKLYDNTDDQLDFNSFFKLMKPHLNDYLHTLSLTKSLTIQDIIVSLDSKYFIITK
ncbi:uncharacterized protein LOC126895339 isoform X2 [Daktulosphaira vitifoliae]|uniref:uncharacterized protein LOC126895339 isoform X2 n=1 Tax=Daktulosphaira vitifoliae TaxID=58002 RepID=UPI0021AA2E3D|nr:uncharacterized protein LOC126895339 isoform X2 [Daktulosphaira vitifoliae]